MNSSNDNSPRAKVWRIFEPAFVIAAVLHMPFFPLQFMTAFGGGSTFFTVLTFYDFINWIATYVLFTEFAGLGSPYFIIGLVGGVVGIIVEIHNGVYIILKDYGSDDFLSSPTGNIHPLLLALGLLLALVKEVVFLSGIIIFQNPRYNPRGSDNQSLLKTGPQSDTQNPWPQPNSPQPWPNQANNMNPQPSVPAQGGITVYPNDKMPSPVWPTSNTKDIKPGYDPSWPVPSGNQNAKQV